MAYVATWRNTGGEAAMLEAANRNRITSMQQIAQGVGGVGSALTGYADRVQKKQQLEDDEQRADAEFGLRQAAGIRAGEAIAYGKEQDVISNALAESEFQLKKGKVDRAVKKEADDQAQIQGILSAGQATAQGGSARDAFRTASRISAVNKGKGAAYAAANLIHGSMDDALKADVDSTASELKDFVPTDSQTFFDALGSAAKARDIRPEALYASTPERTHQALLGKLMTGEDSLMIADADSNINSALAIVSDPASSKEDVQTSLDKLVGSQANANKWAERTRKTLGGMLVPSDQKNRVEKELVGKDSRLGAINSAISNTRTALAKFGAEGRKEKVKKAVSIADKQKKIIDYGTDRNEMIGDIIKTVPKGKVDETLDDVERFVDDVAPVLAKQMPRGIPRGIAMKVIIDNVSTGEHLGGWSPTEFVETVGVDTLVFQAYNLMKKSGMDMSEVKWSDGIPTGEVKPETFDAIAP